jgi:hypothetical protein
MGRGSNCVSANGTPAQSLLFGHRHASAAVTAFNSDHPSRGTQATALRVIQQCQHGQPEPLLNILERYNDATPEEYPLLEQLVGCVHDQLDLVAQDAGVVAPNLSSRALTLPLWQHIDHMLAEDDSCQLFDRLAPALTKASIVNHDPVQITAAASCLVRHIDSRSPLVDQAIAQLADPRLDGYFNPALAQAQFDLLLAGPDSPRLQALRQTWVGELQLGACPLSEDQFERLFADDLPTGSKPLRQAVLKMAGQAYVAPGPALEKYLNKDGVLPSTARQQLRHALVSRLVNYELPSGQVVAARDALADLGIPETVSHPIIVQLEAELEDRREALSAELYRGRVVSEWTESDRSREAMRVALARATVQHPPSNDILAQMYQDPVSASYWNQLHKRYLARRLLPDRQIADVFDIESWARFWDQRLSADSTLHWTKQPLQDFLAHELSRRLDR